MYNINSMWDVLYRYPMDSLLLLFTVISMGYFAYKATKRARIIYGLFTVFSILFIFNPICFRIVGRFGLMDVYYRFFWAGPMIPMIAVFMVKLIQKCDSSYAKIGIVSVFVICVIMGRTAERIELHLSSDDNIYGFRDDIIEISDMLENDTDKSEPTVLTDDYVFTKLRCYNADIVYKVPRQYYLSNQRSEDGYYQEDGTYNPALVRFEQLGEMPEEDVMREILKEYGFDYIIIKCEYGAREYLEKFNYTLLGTTDLYDVYKLETEG